MYNIIFYMRIAIILFQIIHVDGSVDAERDIAVINFELVLSDLAQVERALERAAKSRNKVCVSLFNF